MLTKDLVINMHATYVFMGIGVPPVEGVAWGLFSDTAIMRAFRAPLSIPELLMKCGITSEEELHGRTTLSCSMREKAKLHPK